MKTRTKIFLGIILILGLYRYYMTRSFVATGIYERSPNQTKIAHIHEHDVEKFWGGIRNYSSIKIKDENGETILRLIHDHGENYYNWYSNGKIIWTSDSELKFNLNNKTIITLNLDKH
jgi:hypothetical protein